MNSGDRQHCWSFETRLGSVESPGANLASAALFLRREAWRRPRRFCGGGRRPPSQLSLALEVATSVEAAQRDFEGETTDFPASPSTSTAATRLARRSTLRSGGSAGAGRMK